MRRLALVVALAACGHGSSPPPPDMFEPPPPPPPPRGDVTVRVVANGAGVAGVRVIVQDAAEQPIASELTDGSGLVRAEIEGFNAIVTVVDPYGPSNDGVHDLRTWRDVAVGDTLVLDGAPQAPITVTFTAPLDAAATRYELHTTCGSGPLAKQAATASGAIQLVGCRDVADLLVVGFDASDAVVATLHQPGVGVADGATVTVAGSYLSVFTSAVTWNGFAATSIEATTGIRAARGTLFGVTAAIPFTSGFETRNVPMPTVGPSDVMVLETRVPPRDSDVAARTVVDWMFPTSNAFVDLFGNLPPILSAPALQPPRDVFWSEGGFATGPTVLLETPTPPKVGPDVVVVTLQATRGELSWRWTLAKRHEGPAARFPLLPADAADFNLALGDTVVIADFWQAQLASGYDLLRPRVHDVRTSQDLVDNTFGGRAVVQRIAP